MINNSNNKYTLGNSLNNCKNCHLLKLCIAAKLNESELNEFSELVIRRRNFQKGEVPFLAGYEARSLYMIRTGSMKSYIDSIDGERHITSFQFPGDLFGMDGIEDKVHVSSIQALESTSVCELNFKAFEQLGERIPMLQHQMLRFFSREILRKNNVLMLLSNMLGKRRFASFLIDISKSINAHNLITHNFNLSMKRRDIANYLGMTIESLSRLFSRFQELKLINVKNSRIEINDFDGLQDIVGNINPIQQQIIHQNYKVNNTRSSQLSLSLA